MTQLSTDRMIRVSDLARRYGFSNETFYRHIRAGTMPGVVRWPTGTIRLKESVAEAWVAQQMRQAG